MKINKFKKIKSSLYEVWIDSEKYKLYDEIILKYNLLITKEIDHKLFDKIIEENEKYACYESALKYLDIKLRTKSEIKNYLEKKEYNSNLIEETINKLDNNNFFNSKLYLTSFVNDQINLTNNGPYKIFNNLIRLGFNENEINNFLDFDDKIWSIKITKYIQKKINTNRKLSNFELKRKISNDLINLGYKIELVNSLLENIKVDDQDLFNKLADKVYSKLEKKYQEPKLSYYFRSKMSNSGYDLELINDFIKNKK